MKIKIFYSRTMADALREIKDSLGPEALILSTQEIPRRAGVWGKSSGFQVVAASDNNEDFELLSDSVEAESRSKRARPAKKGTPEAAVQPVLSGIYSPATLAQNASRPSAKTEKINESALPPALNGTKEVPSVKEGILNDEISRGLHRELLRCGVDKLLTQELLATAAESFTAGQRRSREAMMRSLSQAALNLISVPSSQNGLPEKKVIAFVGPTGVGKSTAIAKLAARLALQKKKKVVLMTLDGYHIGAVDQLRSYASLMGIPFRFIHEVSDLPRAIEENRQRDYILIDTPGRGPKDLKTMQSLAEFLKGSDFMERHLVLSAATKSSDMRSTMDQFEFCRPDHLLFTKLDETSTPGPILNELVRTQKCFSYYTDGQRVPDDLHAVPGENLMNIVLHQTVYASKE